MFVCEILKKNLGSSICFFYYRYRAFLIKVTLVSDRSYTAYSVCLTMLSAACCLYVNLLLLRPLSRLWRVGVNATFTFGSKGSVSANVMLNNHRICFKPTVVNMLCHCCNPSGSLYQIEPAVFFYVYRVRWLSKFKCHLFNNHSSII